MFSAHHSDETLLFASLKQDGTISFKYTMAQTKFA